jgi:superfamily II helicase
MTPIKLKKSNTQVRKTMKEITYTLQNSEFITDKMQSIDSGCTLIESPTGSGKTSFVLEQLTTTQKILMLVPLVGQVRQLKSTYANRSDIVFLSGTDKNSTRAIADHQGKHIVATYDIWPHLKNKLKFINYTLVVDEIHKLYSAGSYRDEALNPLLDALADKTTFVKKLMLTATYTPNLAEIANILPDTWIRVTRPMTAAPKKLTVNVYSQQWSYHWLKAVLQRLSLRTGAQIVFVRLNSNARMEKAAECLKTSGYKVLAVSRRTLGNDVVKQVLTEQELPKGYDVVLTTSIFDEAINLNNADSDIDSVHIVDASAHPEEIVQFMGRLRNANPPFFLHIQKDASFLNPLEKYSTKLSVGNTYKHNTTR